ncbi:hypothetical protein [Psychroserpens sp. SPM9]|uniref:hypothetical protein n=1 Tax=Psychroserpens sp. SPM9 TaxID=2975598 RepID=UPI0021A7D0E2|nr:hypothetical protein [Psychroserpens sp. SPM9]MDG5491549.1 hypothetical protein [Psychroserpens sp. SPM9]
MAQVDKKRVVVAALVGGIVFCVIIVIFDYLLGRGFSLKRLAFYFPFAVLMYGFLTYRNFKKHDKNNQ